MKAILFAGITWLTILSSLSAKSQATPSSLFFQNVDVAGYQKASFTLECWFYAERTDLNTGSLLMAISTEKGKQLNVMFDKYSMESFQPGQWNKLTLSGKIDKRADMLSVGALYSGKGKFFYDDIKLTIKSKEGEQGLTLQNGDFEATDLAPWKFANTPAAVNIAVTDTLVHTGKQALCIDASKIASYTYGNNDTAAHYATINGNRIYYETYGTGTPLLLLHGALESIQAFGNQIPALSRQFKVIAVDTRGHGKSTADTTRLTYELYAADMYQLLNTLKLDSVNVLGWSDGGNTGLILAMQHPEKVRKLAVMGANLYNDHTAVQEWVNDTLRQQIKRLEQTSSSGHDFELRVKRTLLTEPHVLPASLQAIKCPVLVMAGEKDVIKEAHTELIANSIPNGHLLIFKKATHDAPREIPDQFNKAILDFFHP